MTTDIRKRGRPPRSAKPEAEKIRKKRGRTAQEITPQTVRCPTKRVYICSPLKGNVERNTARAQRYCRFAFDNGYVPICPQIYYPQFLDDTNKKERAAGMRYALESMWQAREVWVFGEVFTDGMRAEITLARELKIPVRYFDSDMEEIKEK